MTDRREQLLAALSARNPDLAVHMEAALHLATQPGAINLKLAAHALRELGAMLPDSLDLDRLRGKRDESRLRELARRWEMLRPAKDGQESIEPEGLDQTAGARSVEVPEDLVKETHQVLAGYREGGSNYAELVRAMVRALDPLGDPSIHSQLEPSVRQWLELHEWFVGRCHHRQDLEELEAQRQRFDERLSLYEQALHAMLTRAIDTLPELSTLAKRSPAEAGVVERVLALIKKAEHLRRFFATLDNPEWIGPLERAKFFKAPPPLIREGDIVSFPQWPQSQFLARVAGSAPQEVTALVRRLRNTDNNSIRDDFVQCAIAMPARNAAELVPVFVGWLRRPIYLRLPLLLGQLVDKLATEEQPEAAVRLLDGLLAFSPPTSRPNRYSGAVHPHVDGFLFSMLLKKHIPAVAKQKPIDVLKMLGGKLARAIRLERRGGQDDYSWIWMVDLAADKSGRGVKEHLTASLTTLSVLIGKRSPDYMAQVLAELQSHPSTVFSRIRLRALAEGDAPVESQVSELLDLAHFEDHRLRREYNGLLMAAWKRLSEAQREVFLRWVLEGPSDLEHFIERQTERRGHPPPQEEVERYRKRWQLGRIVPLDGLLDGEVQRHYERLQAEVEPFSEAPSEVVTWVGPTSPFSTDEFERKDPHEAIKLLRSWRPSGEVMDHSREGLARVLGTVVAEKPREWSALAREFREGIDPTYVRSFIEGLGGSTQVKGLDWTALTDLCVWIIEQPREPIAGRTEDEDPDWGWARRSVGGLLRRGMQRGLGLPFNNREQVWRILVQLLHDPDPRPENEPASGSGEGRDVFTVSLNSVRGEATHALIEYALWCARNLKEARQEPQAWLDAMPEVRTILAEKLDRSREPSNAIRAALATYLPNLLFLDRKWLEQELPALFGDLGPAWEAYLLYAEPHRAIAPLLVPYYARAAAALNHSEESQEPNDAEKQLAEHIVLLDAYLGDEHLDTTELVNTFFGNAPVALRAHALGFLGWHLSEAKGVSDSAVRRMLGIVERRVTACGRDGVAADELVDLGSFFGAELVSNEWLLKTISDALVLTGGRIQPQHLVAERLAKMSETRPARALQLLKLIVEGGLGQWDIYSWTEPAEAILRVGLRDEATRALARDVINGFTERGYGQFEKLLEAPPDGSAPEHS